MPWVGTLLVEICLWKRIFVRLVNWANMCWPLSLSTYLTNHLPTTNLLSTAGLGALTSRRMKPSWHPKHVISPFHDSAIILAEWPRTFLMCLPSPTAQTCTQPLRLPTDRRFPHKCNTRLKIISNSKGLGLTYIISEVRLNTSSPSTTWERRALIKQDVSNCIWSLYFMPCPCAGQSAAVSSQAAT
jgi:hypothetical protein